MSLKVIEAFGGIGACTQALKRNKVDYEVVDYIEINDYAVKSYNAINDTNFEPQDITKWDKDMECDLFMHGSPCLTEDSLILTNKGYIPMKEISVGDKVLTKSNTWHKVNKKFDNGVHPTIYLNGMGFENIHCTPEHKFYVRKMGKKWNNSKRSYDRVFDAPEFVEAKCITKNHYLGVPVIKEEIPFYIDKLDFWYLLGFYVGDGWLAAKYKKTTNDVIFAMTDKKLEKILSHAKQQDWKWTINDKKLNKSCYRLRFANKDFYNFVEKYIGTGCNSKHIPYEILCLPKEQLNAFYEGYLDSDGCRIKNTDTYQFSTVNRNLLYSFSLIINKLFNRPTLITKVNVSPKKVIEGRVVNQQDFYILRFHKSIKKQDHAFYKDGYIWYPFTKSTKGEEEHVYNMEVDVDHSYIVQGCISKNCQDFSLAGLRMGGDENSGTRSSLMYESIRIINKLKPKYVIWENVKNLLSKQNKHNYDKYLDALSKMGYTNYARVLNSKNYGIPQNRERIFTISIRKDVDKGFEFPQKQELRLKLKDVLEKEVPESYYLSESKIEKISKWNAYQKPLEKVYGNESIVPTLTARGAGEEHSGMILFSDKLNDATNIQQEFIPIKNNTKKGYLEAYDGDGVKINRVDKRRGNVQPESIPTLMTSLDIGVVVKEDKNLKQQLCDELVDSGKVKEGDVIRHSYATSRFEDESRLVENKRDNEIFPTLDTRPDTFGVTVNDDIGLFNYADSDTFAKGKRDLGVSDTYPTLKATDTNRGIYKVSNLRIRKLTPRECWRLMGFAIHNEDGTFDDTCFDRAQEVNSNTQLYKQAGNSIVVNVLQAIFKNLLHEDKLDSQLTEEGRVDNLW